MGKKTNVVDDIKAVVRRSSGRFIPSELLESIASRIEEEYVELPVDKDGVPIKVDDTVYGKSGGKWDVIGFTVGESPYLKGRANVHVADDIGRKYSFSPSLLSHKLPDSLECIADELDEIVDTARSADDSCERLADLADRIRKLAKEEDK